MVYQIFGLALFVTTLCMDSTVLVATLVTDSARLVARLIVSATKPQKKTACMYNSVQHDNAWVAVCSTHMHIHVQMHVHAYLHLNVCCML